MDFFKSVFSTDPEPSDPYQHEDEEEEEEDEVEEEEEGQTDEFTDNPNPNPTSPLSAAVGGSWSLGGIIKTFASKSESVIQTYKRDLEEFGSGLKKETEAIREAATRAVKDLPGSLEAGASVAQESLESVGQAIDDLGGTVADIISQGKDALLSADSEAAADPNFETQQGLAAGSSSSKRYSRFEAQLLAIQTDPATFSEEPEDPEAFGQWRSGFDLSEKEEEIENLLYENGGLDAIFEKLVPGSMDHDTFWGRYYYKVHKFKQAEDARADFVKRVISREEEEELSWEVDDEDFEEEHKRGEDREETVKEEVETNIEEKEKPGDGTIIAPTESTEEEKEPVVEVFQVEKLEEKEPVVEVSQVEKSEEKEPSVEVSQVEKSEEKVPVVEVSQAEKSEDLVATPDDELPSMEANADDADLNNYDLPSKVEEKKVEPVESCKDSDFSVVSSQQSTQEEDDLEWDEIEDLGEQNDKKMGGSSGSPNMVDLRKRLSAAEEDEDLSWDIEDEDEPAKA